MRKYVVHVREIIYHNFEVEANSIEEAKATYIKKALDRELDYSNGNLISSSIRGIMEQEDYNYGEEERT